MSKLSLYTPERFPSFIQENNLSIVKFIQSYYESLQSPFYPLDLVDNLLEYYNVDNEYFNNLVEKTEFVSIDSEAVTVKSTDGFPESGFIKINEEIIYYTSKSNVQFKGISRASTALVRDGNTFTLKESFVGLHEAGNAVFNLAYDFIFYFYLKLKYEILNEFPEKLNENLNISTIFKKIKDFYLVKGSEISDKLLFKILFNDQILDITLDDFGSGAELELVLSGGTISSVNVISGGSNYSNTVEIITTGNGNNAKFDVTVVDGVITTVDVLNPGSNFDNNSQIIAKNKIFSLDEIVYGEFGGIGRVVRSNETNISLYILNKTFKYGELIKSDKTEGVINKFVTKDVDPVKKFPINHTIKLSDFKVNSYDFVTISEVNGEDKLEELRNNNTFTYSICNVDYTLFYDDVIKVFDPFGKVSYNISLTKSEKLYPNIKTEVLKVEDDTVTVDNATGFPVNNGYFLVDGHEYWYSTRKLNQFLGVIPIDHSETISVNNILQFYAYDFGTNKVLNTFKQGNTNYLIEPKFESVGIFKGGSGFTENLTLNLKDSRINELDSFTDNWRTNETLITKDTASNNSIFCDINSVFEYNNDVYVSFSEVPNRDLDYVSLGAVDQNTLKRIGKEQKIIDSPSINERGIGILLDGTQIQSFRGKTLKYGKYSEIKIVNEGNDYLLIEDSGNTIRPYLDVSLPNGNNIYLEEQVQVFGSIKDISILNISSNDLNGFISKPTYTVENAVGDNGSGLILDFKLEYTYDGDIVSNIKILGIIIVNGGQNYTKKPTIKILGGGKVSEITIPKDDIIIKGGIRFLDGSLVKNYSTIDLKTSYISTSTEPDTTLDSFERIINPTVEYGSGGEINVFVQSGSITLVDIVNPGKNYLTPPTLVVNGVGTGAILRAELTNGEITNVVIENGGTGYSVTPVIDIVTGGIGFRTLADITSWTFNVPEVITTDAYGGFVFDENDPDHALTLSKSLLASREVQPGYSQLSYNHNITNNTYWNLSDVEHSKLIGWAYDNTPIYSAYRAYTYGLNPDNLSSTALTSSYQLKSSADVYRPSTSTYPLGYFIEDYEFIAGSGDLDIYNGRYTVTPEFPEGKYCYFATDNFPYFIGLTHKYTVDPYNKLVYNSIDHISNDFLKVHYNDNYPFQKNLSGNSNLNTLSISSGSIDKILIESNGNNYNLNDVVFVDNTNTSGSGLSCTISKIAGLTIDSFTYDSPNKKVEITISEPHLLNDGDTVNITEIIINNSITSLTTLTIDSSTPTTTILKHINYKFELDSSFVDSGNQLYTLHLSQDTSAINKLYFDQYTYNRRDITLNTSVLPKVFYLIVTEASGSVVKTVKVINDNFDIFGSKIILKESDTSFSYIVNDLADTYSSIIDIQSYTVEQTTGNYLGALEEVKILTGGSGYKTTPKLSVISDIGNGVNLNCSGANIGTITSAIINKNTDFCLGYKQDYYETLTYYSGKIKDNIELFDLDLNTPFFLEGFSPTVKIKDTNIILDVTFSNSGNYYFDITLNTPILSLNAEREIEVLFQSDTEFDGVTDTYSLSDTDDVPLTGNSVNNTLLFRNGAFQSENEYTFTGNDITFSSGNIPTGLEEIFGLKFENDFEDLTFTFTDLTTSYRLDVSSNIVDFTNAENRLLIFKEGILQSKTLWTWDNVNEYIVFNEPVDISFNDPYLNIEIKLLNTAYNFYTTADSSIILTDQNNYTFTGIEAVSETDLLFSYNGVVQRLNSGFIRDNTDFVSSVPVESLRILDDSGYTDEVFVYSLNEDTAYFILRGTSSTTGFDIIPRYRRTPLPENNILYTSLGQELLFLDSKDNSSVIFYNKDNMQISEEEMIVYYADNSIYGTLYNIDSAELYVTIGSKVSKKEIVKNTKLSDIFSRTSSNYYNTFTSDVGFYRNPDTWLNTYKTLCKPVGSKPYSTRLYESFSTINKQERVTTELEIS